MKIYRTYSLRTDPDAETLAYVPQAMGGLFFCFESLFKEPQPEVPCGSAAALQVWGANDTAFMYVRLSRWLQ